MSTSAVLLAYDGTSFAGYAAQPGRRTVQGEFESALRSVSGVDVATTAAGRTDAGVHALGQVVSFDTPDGWAPDSLGRALGSVLPPDISVLDVQVTPEGFSARYSAQARTYVYLLWTHRAGHPLIDRFVVHEPRLVDAEAMDTVLREMMGTHDFTSMARVRVDQDPVRTVLDAGAERDGDLVRCRITAHSFLHQMVRSMVGTALDVALGRRSPGSVPDVLARRDRSAAGKVMPPHGLSLVDVTYDDLEWPERPEPVRLWATMGVAAF